MAAADVVEHERQPSSLVAQLKECRPTRTSVAHRSLASVEEVVDAVSMRACRRKKKGERKAMAVLGRERVIAALLNSA
jgi:hypothetical protein